MKSQFSKLRYFSKQEVKLVQLGNAFMVQLHSFVALQLGAADADVTRVESEAFLLHFGGSRKLRIAQKFKQLAGLPKIHFTTAN